jgi:hypothetical protein
MDRSTPCHDERLVFVARFLSPLKFRKTEGRGNLRQGQKVRTRPRRRLIGPSAITFFAALAAVMLWCQPSHSGELDSERDEDVDLAFVGSARETGTLRPIPGVQIRAETGGRRILVRTNTEGVYRLIPNFGDGVTADQVTISCAKDGYEAVDVSRRKLSDKKVKELVVAECLLAPKP